MARSTKGAVILAAELAKRGLTQVDAAKLLDCNSAYLSRILSGDRKNIGLKLALKIRDEFGLAPELWLPSKRARAA